MKREEKVASVDELISILSKKNHAQAYTVAKASNTCVVCKEKATEFSNLKAKFEYNNSAICETCQMKYFG